jgi:transposase
MIPLINSIPEVTFKNNRKRKTPKILQADKAYDSILHAEAMRQMGVRLEAPKRGQKTKRPLGRARWKVERSMAWLKNFRRLRVRYEKRADMHEAMLTVATIVIALKKAVELFC